MTILSRNSGVVNTPSNTWTVTKASGSFGTGTVIVVAIFGNTVFSTPAGWTQRASSVADMGLYSYDKTAAGEASLAFTCTAAGTGEWFVWELSAGSTFLDALATQAASPTLTAHPTPNLTPTAGNRHLLAVAGGNGSLTRSVTAWSNSFVGGGTLTGGHATGGDNTFSGAADRDVTADGVTAYGTTATLSTGTATRGGLLASYVAAGSDTTAPSVPAGLTVAAVGQTTVDLTWTAATDNVGVTGYDLEIVGP